jgi:hypothetical protein
MEEFACNICLRRWVLLRQEGLAIKKISEWAKEAGKEHAQICKRK